jgi:rhodanese-related sulfurtransferase
MKSKSAFHGALAVLVLGSILGLGFNLFNPNGLSWVGKKRQTTILTEGAAEAATPAEKPMTRSEPGDPPAEAVQEPSPTDEEGTPEELYADVPTSEFPIEITLAQGKSFYDRGGLVVIDAREHDEFDEGHIQGATCAPMDEKAGDLKWLEQMGSEPHPIMVYCGGGDCELSLDLAFLINENGHRRVMVLTDGYPAWEEAGYPVVKGGTE